MVSLSDNEILVENYDLDWTRAEDCDMILKFDGTCWRGELATPGKCTGVKGYRVVSEIYIFKDKLHTMDQGYNSEGKWYGVLNNYTNLPVWANSFSGRATRFTPSRSGVRSPLRPLSFFIMTKPTKEEIIDLSCITTILIITHFLTMV